MDPTGTPENDFVASPQNATLRKKSSENHGEASRKTPSGKAQTKSSEVKAKKPKLPLYSSKKAKNLKEKQVTVDDILKQVKSLDECVVSKSDKPALQKSDVKQLMRSSSLETPSEEVERSAAIWESVEGLFLPNRGNTRGHSQEGDSEDIVQFRSHLLCGDNQQASSQDSKRGSQDEPRRHSFHGTVAKEDQNPNSFDLEANAAQSVLDVSDFGTCMKVQQDKEKREIVRPATFLFNGSSIHENETQTHSMAVNPSSTQKSSGLGLFSQQNWTSGTLTGFKERTDCPTVETNINEDSLVVQPSLTDTADKPKITSDGSDEKMSENPYKHDVRATENWHTQSECDLVSLRRGEHETVFPEYHITPGRQCENPFTVSSDQPSISESSNSKSCHDGRVFTSLPEIETAEPVMSTTPGSSLQLFATAGGREVSAPDESNPEADVPSKNTVGPQADTVRPSFHTLTGYCSQSFSMEGVQTSFLGTSTSRTELDICAPMVETSHAVSSNGLQLFSTAGGMKVSAPKNSLDKYKAMLEQCSNHTAEPRPHTSISEAESVVQSFAPSTAIPGNGLPLFSTAGGKKVAAPNATLNKYLAELSQCFSDNPSKSISQPSVPDKIIPTLQMDIPSPSPPASTSMHTTGALLFSTAGGRKVTAPKVSLDQYMTVLGQCSDDPSETNFKISTPGTSRSAVGKGQLDKQGLHCPGSQLLNSPTPRNTLDKLRFDSFLEGGVSRSIERAVLDQLYTGDPGESTPLASVPVTEIEVSLAGPVLDTSSTVHGNELQLFSTAGGRKVSAPKTVVDQYLAKLGQCTDDPTESNHGMTAPEMNPSGIARTDEQVLCCPGAQLLNSQAVENAENTPRCLRKKPRFESFLEGDAELFEKLQTPSKVEIGPFVAVDREGDFEEHHTCPVSGDTENDDDLDAYNENRSNSPVLILDNAILFGRTADPKGPSVHSQNPSDGKITKEESSNEAENRSNSPALTLDKATLFERTSDLKRLSVHSQNPSTGKSKKEESSDEAKDAHSSLFSKDGQLNEGILNFKRKQDCSVWRTEKSENSQECQVSYSTHESGGKAVYQLGDSQERVEGLPDQDRQEFDFYQKMPGSPVLSSFDNMLTRNEVKTVESFVPSPARLISNPRCTTTFKSAGENTVSVSTSSLKNAVSMFSNVDNGLNGPDVQDALTAGAAVIGDEGRSPSPVLDFAPPQNTSLREHSGNTPFTRSPVPSKESNSDWEEFPELKSSQAALLEQSAKKENIASAANLQAPNGVNVEMESRLGKTRNPETCVKPRSPLAKSAVRMRTSTPLSSRTSDPEVGTKRKSLPTSLEFAAKKPRTLFHDTDDFIRANLKAKINHVIAYKKKQKITPALGILSQKKRKPSMLKLVNLQTLSELDEEEKLDEAYTCGNTLLVSSVNAVDFRFRLSANFLNTGTLMADSCFLLPSPDGTAGLEEVTAAFLTSPHVDPKLVPDGWVKNHYRWIIWKLACYDRRFPRLFTESCLSIENVLLQLKYRYDREIDRVERSAFKKLLEGDSAPNKFICCVSSIKKNRLDEGESLFEFELTDGWYSVWAVIDAAMATLCQKGLVAIGTKLVVHGAEITNCGQGCDPLNVPSDVKLKISTNSVRRAKWFARMGFLRNNKPIPNLLCDVLPEGGIVGKLTTVVVRKYPVIFMCKDANGKTVFRNERSQAAFQDLMEKKRTEYAEMIREKLFKEAESRHKPVKPLKKYTANEIASMSDPEELYSVCSAVGEDGEFMQSQMSADQLRCILKYKEEVASRIQSDVQKELQALIGEWESNSKVTKLLKVRLMDSCSEKHAVLTIWRPTEDDWSAVSENKAFVFFNVAANATRDGVLQLSSTRQTTFEDVPSDILRCLQPSKDFERVATPLGAVESPNFYPAFGELDTAGVVVLVKLPEQSGGVTVVYVSDLDGHYLSITFWTSLSVFGCEDLMTEGSLIACSNLQWRSVSSQRKKIPSVFASEITSFTRSPKPNHLRLHLQQVKNSLAKKDIAETVGIAKAHVLQTSKSRDLPSSVVGSPATSPRFPSAITPLRSVGTPARRCPTDAPSKSNRHIPEVRTPAGQRLETLNRFGEDAPPLTPMPLNVTTRKVFHDFKSPYVTPHQ